jgi:tetratricopeptide (TPR) repeat protein
VGGVILVAGAIAVYRRTFSVPFLFDDAAAIVDNATIRHWSTAWWPPINTTASGRPILNLSLAINYAVSGTAVWSYHALNLAIHVWAGLTLFGIVRRTLGLVGRVIPNPPLSVSDPSDRRVKDNAPYLANATLLAFFAALLWTLHPLQTESVTYIIQRAESLMGLFYLLTIYCFIRGICAERADASGPRAGRVPGVWFVCAVVTCLLGMATKEVTVSAPLIVLLYDRTFVAGSFREAWRRRRGLYLALAATWLPLIGLVASTGGNRSGTSGFDVGITPWAYWLTQFEAVTRYLRLSMWPHPLVFQYGATWVNRPAEVVPYALVVVLLAAAVLVALWRRPMLGFLGAWFFVILAPTSIMPGRIQTIVEHRMYLPLAAVTTLAAMGIHAAVRRRSWMVYGAVALGLSLLTVSRNEDYRSQLTIWSDTVAKRPNNERAHYDLGVAWSQVPGRLNDAIAQYEAALHLQPDYAEAHNNLGLAWSQMPGRLKDALAQYEAALRLQPDYAEAHNNLGAAWAQLPGRLDDAIIQFRQALLLRPDYAEAHNNLGLAWSHLPGRLNDAIARFQSALRLKPDYAEAHLNLGDAWSQIPGRLDDAVAEYGAALRLKPDLAEAHHNLGVAWSRIPGRLDDAVAEYKEALRLKPGFAEAHTNLGLAWSRMPGRRNDAVAEYKEALRLRPDYAPAWHNLGTSLFYLGDLPAAAAAFREELGLSPNDPAAQQALAAVLQQTGGH